MQSSPPFTHRAVCQCGWWSKPDLKARVDRYAENHWRNYHELSPEFSFHWEIFRIPVNSSEDKALSLSDWDKISENLPEIPCWDEDCVFGTHKPSFRPAACEKCTTCGTHEYMGWTDTEDSGGSTYQCLKCNE